MNGDRSEAGGALVEIIGWIDLGDFENGAARVATGESGDVTELSAGETDWIGCGDAGSIGGGDGIHVETPENLTGFAQAKDRFESEPNTSLTEIGHGDGVRAFVIEIVQMGGGDGEGLIGDFVEVGRNKERFFKEHAIGSATVADGILANVEMGVNIESEQVGSPAVSGKGAAIGIGDVVTAAEDDEFFVIGEYLLND